MTSTRNCNQSTHTSVQKSLQIEQPTEEPILLTENYFLEQRKEELKKVENSMQEVAGMFKELAELVNKQQPQIDVIEENIICAKVIVTIANNELDKADGYARNRCIVM